MSDAIVVALIGVAGTVVGASATVLAASIHARKPTQPTPPAGTPLDPTPVLGKAVDIRELRILRALYGERKGRVLEAYRDGYYGPSLRATVSKGWVRLDGGTYTLTAEGADLCRIYLRQLHETWQPPRA